MPIGIGQPEIDETRAGYLRRLHIRIPGKHFGEANGKLSRFHSERLGKHHRRVCGEVAMRGIARWLDNHPLRIESHRPRSVRR